MGWEVVRFLQGSQAWAHSLSMSKGFMPFRYQGQYENIEIGLYYNRFRYYSPDSGTYISQDPIGLEGNNPNFYGYTFDSNTEVDVWGLYDTVYFSNPIKQVIIKMQGDRELDYKEANKAAEINEKRGKPTIKAHKDNYGDVVWHHAAYDEKTNSCIMQLVHILFFYYNPFLSFKKGFLKNLNIVNFPNF